MTTLSSLFDVRCLIFVCSFFGTLQLFIFLDGATAATNLSTLTVPPPPPLVEEAVHPSPVVHLVRRHRVVQVPGGGDRHVHRHRAVPPQLAGAVVVARPYRDVPPSVGDGHRHSGGQGHHHHRGSRVDRRRRAV